jgi:hypothetical protein
MAETNASAKKTPKTKAAKPAEPVEVDVVEVKKAAEAEEKAAKPAKTAKPVKSAGKPKPDKKTEAKAENAAALPARSIDDVTIALWNLLDKADVSALQPPVAIQVVITGVGTFFVAIKSGENGNEKHIIQDIYHDRNGTFETTYDVLFEIIKGQFDFASAFKNGRVHYHGDLAKAVALKNVFGF